MNLDRFSQGRSDPAEELPIMECAACGLELYSGDKYFEVDGQISCNDAECIAALAIGIEQRTA